MDNPRIYDSADEASEHVADLIASTISTVNAQGKPCVLGLATGSTPIGVYKQLVRLHQQEGLSFANVITFNLDEYYPMLPSSVHSYWHFMHHHLFDHIDIPRTHIHIPDGTVDPAAVDDHCARYEAAIAAAGGIDLQLLGIGRNGHIGFNESGSTEDSRTRRVALAATTREDAAKDFGGLENVPEEAITMGVATILGARSIVLLALGERKASTVAAALEGPRNAQVPASFLRGHHSARVVLDRGAASALRRRSTSVPPAAMHAAMRVMVRC